MPILEVYATAVSFSSVRLSAKEPRPSALDISLPVGSRVTLSRFRETIKRYRIVCFCLIHFQVELPTLTVRDDSRGDWVGKMCSKNHCIRIGAALDNILPRLC